MIVLRRLRTVAGLLGTVLASFSLLYLVPLAVALLYGNSIVPYLVPMGISAVLGLGLSYYLREEELEVADGFLLVVLTWVTVAILGAVPYVLTGTGSLASPVNALFESVSGFSCTGSTVIRNISLEKYPHALMLWRQLTQWLGGMGILVLAVAVLPRLSVGGSQFLDNEVPGPRMDRLTPHMAETARRLWLLYLTATALLFALLYGLHLVGLAPKMTLFQSISHAFTTLPSGGFSPQARSVAAFSPWVQWALIPFMLVAAMSFVLLWQALFKNPRSLFRNTEFVTYILLFLVGGILVSLMLFFRDSHATLEEHVRHGFFQVTTILTTTGYASTDFAAWSGDILVILLLLMFISGCVGSTSGGIKVFRWLIVVKVIHREVFQRIHPSAVRSLYLGKRVIKPEIVNGALAFVLSYITLFATGVLVITVDLHLTGISLEPAEVVTTVAVTLGNIGPGFGNVGPMENFQFYPWPSKLVMSFMMIAGRLEVMSLLIVLLPSYWKD